MKNLLINSTVENNDAISEFLNSNKTTMAYYIYLVELTIGIDKNGRRWINKLLQEEFMVSKNEAYDFVNFVKQFILN